jgi:CMP-N,N'-diacetyllegionaminic acid synthase
MKTLGVVPARAGSRGVPGKNKRDFMGKPLVAWAIEVSKATCTRTCVTTDDPEILSIAEQYGVQAIIRPPEFAADTTPMVDVLKHVLSVESEPGEALVLLQPTQPLRTVAHVKQALWAFTLAHHADSVVSVVEIPAHMSPDFALKLDDGYLSRFNGSNVSRRQDCHPAYYRDGTVYVIRPGLLVRGEIYGRCCLPLLIDEKESCTIDTEADWSRAERMWRDRQHD